MSILKAKSIHFIGIGGIGSSSIAQILHKKGKKISGSDLVPSNLTKVLQKNGISVSHEHSSKNIKKQHNLVVYSPAIPESNEELQQARKLKIRTISYPEALGELTKGYFTIAIAGTHGKSTTTAITALIAEKAELDPTVVIGTKIKQFKNQNYRVGKTDLLIIEACEYKESFLHLSPNILIITNIEADHLDYYKNLTNYKNSFAKLAGSMKKSDLVIIKKDNKNAQSVVKNIKAKTLAWEKVDLKIQPGVPGKFNIENAIFAALAMQELKVEPKIIERTIRNFKGTWRRMEYKNKKLGKTIFIDDYAHHPTEIQATLTAIRDNHPKAKILCIFQPHQYSRTHQLLKGFGKSFTAADKVIIPDIYKVRDTAADIKKVSAQNLVDEIKKNKSDAENGKSLKKTGEYITKNHSKFDVIVTMGAGDIDQIYKYF